jgi:hypothetical protein
MAFRPSGATGPAIPGNKRVHRLSFRELGLLFWQNQGRGTSEDGQIRQSFCFFLHEFGQALSKTFWTFIPDSSHVESGAVCGGGYLGLFAFHHVDGDFGTIHRAFRKKEMILTFVIVSIFCLLALFFLLSFHRFRNSQNNKYFPWLRTRMPIFFTTPWIERSKEIYQSWFIQRYPANQRWIFLGLASSYVYLVLSGFLFVFIRVRLFGSFLLLHVVLGGLFAVCLCLAVLLRARFYTWNMEDLVLANLQTKAGKRKIWQIVLFWIFVASGLVLVVTALFQMLPQFSLRAQRGIFEVHRYAALEILLAGIAFLYFSLIDDGR